MWSLHNEDIPDHIREHPAQAPRGRKAKGLAQLCLHHTTYSHPQVPRCEEGFRLARGGCRHMNPHQPDHKIIQALFLAQGFGTAAASLTDRWGWVGGHQHYQTHTQLSDSPAPSRSHSHHLTALGSQVSALMHKLRSHFGLQVPILGKQLGSHTLYFISHFCLHASFPLSLSLQSKHRFKWQLQEADLKDNYILQFL